MGRCNGSHKHCCIMVPATIFSNQATFAYAGVTFFTNRVNCHLAEAEVPETVEAIAENTKAKRRSNK